MVKKEKLLSLIDENIIAILLVVLAVFTRLIPHPANFAAVGAVALFSGTYLNKKYALWLPLAAMMVSDAIIGLHNLIFFTWGSFILISFIGLWIRGRKNVKNVVFGTLTGSLLFYFITNGAVWAFTPLYAKTFQGMLECYVMGLPFFRGTVLGDFFYVGVLFGGYEAVRYFLPQLKERLSAVKVRA